MESVELWGGGKRALSSRRHAFDDTMAIDIIPTRDFIFQQEPFPTAAQSVLWPSHSFLEFSILLVQSSSSALQHLTGREELKAAYWRASLPQGIIHFVQQTGSYERFDQPIALRPSEYVDGISRLMLANRRQNIPYLP